MTTNPAPRLFIGTLLLFLVITAVILIHLKTNEIDNLDLLVVWGWRADESGQTNRKCYLWLVNPETQESSQPIIRTDGRCSYDVATLEGVKRLISWEEHSNGSEIAIYKFINWDEISIERTIIFDYPSPNTISQWDKNGYLYYSAPYLNNAVYQEQIYRVKLNQNLALPETFIHYKDGIAADPIVSPDGQFVAYWTLDGPKNRFPRECGLGCAGYYHIFNLSTRQNIELRLLVAEFASHPSIVHCNFHWSPSGRFAAFNMGGCGYMSNKGLIIIDVVNSQVVSFIESTSGHREPTIHQWISDTDLLYTFSISTTEIENTPTWTNELHVYSISGDSSYKLVDLPLITEQDYTFYRIENLRLTQDSNYFAAQIASFTTSGQANFSLYIADLTHHPPIVTQFSHIDRFSGQPDRISFGNPQWSVSAEWVASRSYEFWNDERGISVSFIRIVSNNGKQTFEVDTTHLRPGLHYAWFSPFTD